MQHVTNCKVLWKVPNAFNDLSPSIDNGNPVVRSGGSEIARSYRGLAALLGEEVIDDYWPRVGGPGGGNAPKDGNPPGKPLQKPRKPKLDDGFAAAGLELFEVSIRPLDLPPRFPLPRERRWQGSKLHALWWCAHRLQMTEDTHYAILGVSERATTREIRAAYRCLLKKIHPDTVATLSPGLRRDAEWATKEIIEAYSVLSDAGRRRFYDQQPSVLRGESTPSPSDPDESIDHSFAEAVMEYLFLVVFGAICLLIFGAMLLGYRSIR